MKRKTVLAAWVSILLFVTQVMAAQAQSDEQTSDLWLKAKLVTAYTLNQHLNPFKLDVEVKNGTANLSGTVDSDVERDLAVEIAKGVEGISEVKDNIKIEPGAGADERRESEFFRLVNDASVTARVKSKLLWNSNTSGLDIRVTTEDGIVTLKGDVASPVKKDLAIQLAKNTPGVERVKDDLEVAPKGGKGKNSNAVKAMETKASDAWITTKVKSMLLFSRNTEGAEIEVSTANQVVTLKGTVVSEEQKDAILKMVGDMVGVREVKSDLAIKKS